MKRTKIKFGFEEKKIVRSKIKDKEFLAENLHIWYLEATKKINIESFNKKAQKKYKDLTGEQKFIDRYIAKKIIELIKNSQIQSKKELRLEILNELGIDDSLIGSWENHIRNHLSYYNCTFNGLICPIHILFKKLKKEVKNHGSL